MIDVSLNKAVLITGCDSGFGHLLALQLDSLGFKVFAGCLQVNGSGAQALKNSSSKHLQLQLDVTDHAQVNAALQLINRTLRDQKLWAVVNNAGVALPSEIEWCPVDVLQRMLNVNTLGAVRVTQAFLPLLRESHGRLVFMSSVLGRLVTPGLAGYSISKFGVVALVDGLRRELSRFSISVHSIEPGPYQTGLFKNTDENLKILWDSSSDTIKATYGVDYIDYFQKSFLNMINDVSQSQDEIYHVVDDMVDAVAGAEPLQTYSPKIKDQLLYGLIQWLPPPFLDFIFKNHVPRIRPMKGA